MKLDSIQSILDFAIENEEASREFYIDLAAKVKRPGMREVFENFAREEEGHKAKLLAIKKGELFIPKFAKVVDLKISDYMVDVEPSPDMDYQQALIVAMKKEKVAFRLYTDLAAIADDKTTRTTFLSLAQEEAKHKLRFEIEYDESILTEN